MSDRKYRQRGYQDEGRPAPRPDRPQQPRPEREGPRSPRMMAHRTIVRCTRCGQILDPPFGLAATCPKCGSDLHACGQCAAFDPAQRFECAKPIPARIAPKDRRNTCSLFEPRTTIERETGTSGPKDARSAFDDLFKF